MGDWHWSIEIGGIVVVTIATVLMFGMLMFLFYKIETRQKQLISIETETENKQVPRKRGRTKYHGRVKVHN